MFYTLGILVVSLGLACSRDASKAFRSLPAITNSLVNLGKMDIIIHFNSKTPASESTSTPKPEVYTHSVNSFFAPKQEPMAQQTIEVERTFEPCPCSSLKNFKNPFMGNSPADLIGKILKSSDLFSMNQEPVISTTCCDSHEHVQEDTVFFDFSPRSHTEVQMQPQISPFPMLLDAILPKLQAPVTSNSKPKAIEIFFFPKNKEGFIDFSKLSSLKDKKSKKAEIQVVGDREMKNEFKNVKFRPSFSILSKKELGLLEKQKGREEKKEEKSEIKNDTKQEEKDLTNGDIFKKTTPAPFTAPPN